jgi:hypothetical protein
MTRTRLAGLAALIFWSLGAVSGCSRGPSLAPVEGTLKMNGKPLANVQVEFLPEINGPRSRGVTDKEGKYSLATDDQRAGAVVGSHRVLLYDLQAFDDKPPPGKKKDRDVVPVRPSRVPTRYTEVDNTPLKKEVRKEPNDIELEVKGP